MYVIYVNVITNFYFRFSNSTFVHFSVGSLLSLTVTMLCEVHSQKYRTPLVMFVGFSNSISNIFFPRNSIKLYIFITQSLQFF